MINTELSILEFDHNTEVYVLAMVQKLADSVLCLLTYPDLDIEYQFRIIHSSSDSSLN